MAEKNVLALYNCRSKQEYIYRTDQVQEITDASELYNYGFPIIGARRLKGGFRDAAKLIDCKKSMKFSVYRAAALFTFSFPFCFRLN